VGIRAFTCVAILALSTLCTGCWDATEIDQLAIVVASGMDLVQHDDSQQPTFRGMLQIARPSELGTSGGGTPTTSTGSTGSYVLEQAEGPNALATQDIMRKRLSRKLFVGQRRVIILGEDYARHGVYDLADEILRNPQSRLRTYIVIAYHGTAQSILERPYPLNRLPADAISDLERNGATPEVDAKQFLQRLTSKGDPFAMGIEQTSTLYDASDNPSGAFALTRIAIFQKDKLVGWLGSAQLRGFIWIYGRAKREESTVNIPGTPGYITGRMLGNNTTRSIKIINGKPRIDIHTRSEYDISENGTPLNLNDPKNIQLVRSAITKEVTSQIQSTMDTLQHKYHADSFGFSDLIDKKHPRMWAKMEKHWRETYSSMPVTVRVDVDIRNSGLTGPSLRGSQGTSLQRGAS
jgi:spore germination protein KC